VPWSSLHIDGKENSKIHWKTPKQTYTCFPYSPPQKKSPPSVLLYILLKKLMLRKTFLSTFHLKLNFHLILSSLSINPLHMFFLQENHFLWIWIDLLPLTSMVEEGSLKLRVLLMIGILDGTLMAWPLENFSKSLIWCMCPIKLCVWKERLRLRPTNPLFNALQTHCLNGGRYNPLQL